MAVSYKKLFKLLIDRNIKKKDFRAITGLSYSTLAKLERGDNVNVEVIDRICIKLNCPVEDVMEILLVESDIQNRNSKESSSNG